MPELSTSTLPVLPLPDGVVFPEMVVTVTLASPEARTAVAAAPDGPILLLPRRSDGDTARLCPRRGHRVDREPRQASRRHAGADHSWSATGPRRCRRRRRCPRSVGRGRARRPSPRPDEDEPIAAGRRLPRCGADAARPHRRPPDGRRAQRHRVAGTARRHDRLLARALRRVGASSSSRPSTSRPAAPGDSTGSPRPSPRSRSPSDIARSVGEDLDRVQREAILRRQLAAIRERARRRRRRRRDYRSASPRWPSPCRRQR